MPLAPLAPPDSVAGRTQPYRLVRRSPAPQAAPRLDAAQRRVAVHRGGPLLVVGGPGTGKTTLLVEAAVHYVAERGLDPERLLFLTFGRRAAADLRARVAERLGRTTREPVARTFHSYAFGLLRREAALRGEPPPRLLSGPEQDIVVRELLRGDLADRPGRWPEPLRPALATRGFVQELRDLLLRARERGVEPERLAALGRRHDRPEWTAAARFMRQYTEVTALADVAALDPAELIRLAVDRLRADPGLLSRERASRRLVLVDELHDTDPAQQELLALLAGDGRDLIAVGDPDQAIYGFRGTDPQALRDFPERFRTPSGEPAPVVTLGASRRSGAALVAATRRVTARLGGTGAHRDLQTVPGVPVGAAEVHVLRSQTQEAAYIAHRLRHAHLVDGVAWERMAVLVRSTSHTLAALRRAMVSAGVPVAAAAAAVPLVAQPGVTPLLTLYRCAVSPETLDEETAVALLTSPLGGADALVLRRLRQELRRLEVVAGGGRGSGALLVEALTTPAELASLDRRARRPAERVSGLLATARTVAARPGATAEDVLWEIWSGSGLSEQWQRLSVEGGSQGRAADRDLDAVVALFDAAARFTDRLPNAGPALFLSHLLGQEIVGDTLAARAPEGSGVQVLTAHASKGREWDVVAVAGVQEGLWPGLRPRGSFLGSERLVEILSGDPGTADRAATVAALSRLLDEERRLFYVAATRARRLLLVTAVASEREDLQPSRFLDELDPLPAGADRRRPTDVPRALTLPALVGELRAVVTDPDAEPGLREAAARHLARLAAAGARGADPSTWYGLAPLTDDQPVRAAGESVPVSPSRVETFRRCALRWFLEQAGGTDRPSPGQAVGTLVHAVAAEAAADPAPVDEERLLARLDEAWEALDLGDTWHARRDHARAVAMVRRLAGWLASGTRSLAGVEVDFSVDCGRARITGRVDRLEVDAEGRGVVVDLKTGAGRPKDVELADQPQLAVYQLATALGAFGLLPRSAGTGGAELVQLGDAGLTGRARVQSQPALDAYPDPGWARALVETVAEGMAGAEFPASADAHCDTCPVRTSCPVRDEGRRVGP